MHTVLSNMTASSVASVNGEWISRTPAAVIGGRRVVDGISNKCLECIEAFNTVVMPKNTITDPVTKQLIWSHLFWTIFDFPDVCGVSKSMRPMDIQALYEWQLAAISALRVVDASPQFQSALQDAEARMLKWRTSHLDDQFAFIKLRVRGRSPSGAIAATPLRAISPEATIPTEGISAVPAPDPNMI